jgi:hypothetical protein
MSECRDQKEKQKYAESIEYGLLAGWQVEYNGALAPVKPLQVPVMS